MRLWPTLVPLVIAGVLWEGFAASWYDVAPLPGGQARGSFSEAKRVPFDPSPYSEPYEAKPERPW